MPVVVDFQDEQAEFDVPEDRLVGAWRGPEPLPAADVAGRVADALRNPRDYPSLRQAVVPGDRVIIAVDPEIPSPSIVLEEILAVLSEAGVERDTIHLISPAPVEDARALGITATVHDPADDSHIAYLASTAQGRRIYLNRLLSDADFVLPVGRLGFDPVLGYRGPWSLIYPGLSNAESQRSFRGEAGQGPPGLGRKRALREESAEVSWLLGGQFQIGVVPGASGVSGIVAGLASSVLEQGTRAVDESWTFRAEERAELVVVGIGGPGRPSRVEDLAAGLATATDLVRRGGKVVVLSRVGGDLGPALQRLAGAGEPEAGLPALRESVGEPDYPAALQLANALAWADVYLLSSLEDQVVEDLSMIPLGGPNEARRLAGGAASCLFLSQAELARAEVKDEAE
jgi:lactate racemase